MVLGPTGAGAPLGSTLRFPDGEEWYAFGLTTNRWYRQLSLLIAMSQDSQRWRMCGDAVLRLGQQTYQVGLVSTFSPLYTDLGGTHLDGDGLLQLCLLLHGEHTLPSWMKELEPGQLNLLEIRLEPMPQTLSGEPVVLVLPDGRRWDLAAPLTGLC